MKICRNKHIKIVIEPVEEKTVDYREWSEDIIPVQFDVSDENKTDSDASNPSNIRRWTKRQEIKLIQLFLNYKLRKEDTNWHAIATCLNRTTTAVQSRYHRIYQDESYNDIYNDIYDKIEANIKNEKKTNLKPAMNVNSGKN